MHRVNQLNYATIDEAVAAQTAYIGSTPGEDASDPPSVEQPPMRSSVVASIGRYAVELREIMRHVSKRL